jgi:hypothetical protein
MKVKRIGTLKTLRQYEKQLLEQVLPKYVAKSGVDERPQDILAQIRLECHNPFVLSCVLLDDAGAVIGFFVSFLQLTNLGKRLYIDHMYAPNTGQSAQMWKMITTKLGTDDVLYMTRRDPDAWIKGLGRLGIRVKLHGYLLRTVQDTEMFGKEKED